MLPKYPKPFPKKDDVQATLANSTANGQGELTNVIAAFSVVGQHRRMRIESHAASGQAQGGVVPACSDCAIPTVFRTSVADRDGKRQFRVFQCVNCAKVIWED